MRDSEAVDMDGRLGQEALHDKRGDGEQPKRSKRAIGTPVSARETMRTVVTPR